MSIKVYFLTLCEPLGLRNFVEANCRYYHEAAQIVRTKSL